MTLYFRKLSLSVLLLLLTIGAKAQLINTIAGNGTSGYSGDGGPGTAAQLSNPSGAATDGAGNVYIADYANHRIRKVDATGIITTIAGTGTAGYTGDGAPATAAQLDNPSNVAVDAFGNLYIADSWNHVIRKISTSGIISTIAGNGFGAGTATGAYSGDGGPASAAKLNQPTGVAVDAYFNIYIADLNNQAVRMVNASGGISTIAGTGIAGYTGDSGPATAAELNSPMGVAIDGYGILYIADKNNNVVRSVSSSGVITTFAGNGVPGFSGDAGPAIAAEIFAPAGVAVDASLNVYVADYGNNRIRKIGSSGIITTLAGTGTAGYSGAGGPATAAALRAANVAADPNYSIIYISEGAGERVRRVDTLVTISAITGASTVCAGSAITLSDATSGGVWSSSSTTIATVGASTGVVTGLSAGVTTISYTISGTSVTHNVTVNPLPSMTSSSASACGGVYTITATGGITYSWAPATGLSCTTCSTPAVNPAATTVYTVTGTNVYGCSGTSTISVDGNRISGYVSLSASGSIRVWLIHFNASDSSIIALDSTMTCTTSGGGEYYEFVDPPGGNYRVKANLLGGTPGASGYIPTYSLSSANWYSADTVAHATGTDTMHVNLIYGTVPSGPGFISGYVVSGAGRGTSGDVPAPGVLIYLKNASGNVLTYVYTDAAGTYSFNALAYGTYYVYPEDYKYYTTPSAALVLSSSSAMITGVGFKEHTTSGTITPFVVSTVPSIAANPVISVYPNPLTDELTITGVADITHYRVLNVTGICIVHGLLEKGSNTLSLRHIAAGVYILELTGEDAARSMIRVVKE